jgi:RNA polymerase sigma factor (sigma-70 family)
MSTPSSFAELVRGLEAGDPDAAARLYQRYACRLIGLARRQLSERLRAKVGAEDVVQSVFRTFFRRAADCTFDLGNEDALWALLAEITLRKCGRWHRHFAARKRHGELAAVPAGGDEAGEEPADPREPSPADAVVLLDLVEELFRGLDPRERLVGEMRLQGHAIAEIAQRAGCTEATVFRKLGVIKRRLRRLCPQE